MTYLRCFCIWLCDYNNVYDSDKKGSLLVSNPFKEMEVTMEQKELKDLFLVAPH